MHTQLLAPLLSLLSLFSLSVHASNFWFDAHLHYNQDHAASISQQDVITILNKSAVTRAAVTSTPPVLAKTLYDFAPRRIVPILGVYQSPADKNEWFHDRALPARIRENLKLAPWVAIGELHIFAENRHSNVFRQVVNIARQNDLPLLLHADPAVIDTVYTISPWHSVIWAHAGKYPYPDLLADYMQRYPRLIIDLTMRDERIAPGGQLDDAWYELITTYPKRFVIGVDTYSTAQWQAYQQETEVIRDWTRELPENVRHAVVYSNAARLFPKRLQKK